MTELFEQSRSHWVRYDRYELKTAADGKRYVTPAKDAKPDVYNPMKEMPGMVLDALNVGMLMMGRQDGRGRGSGHSGICHKVRPAGPDDGAAHHAVLHGL